MKLLNYVGISILLVLASGCTLDPNWYHGREVNTSDLGVENYDTPYKRTGVTKIPNLPYVEPAKEIDKVDVQLYLADHYPDVMHQLPQDKRLALLDERSALELIGWVADARWEVGIEYVPESFDCENFAYLAKWAAGLSLSMYHDKVHLSPLMAVIYVKSTWEWAGINDGNHALNAIPCIRSNGDLRIYVFEPQNGAYTTLDHYPNAPYFISLK